MEVDVAVLARGEVAGGDGAGEGGLPVVDADVVGGAVVALVALPADAAHERAAHLQSQPQVQTLHPVGASWEEALPLE